MSKTIIFWYRTNLAGKRVKSEVCGPGGRGKAERRGFLRVCFQGFQAVTDPLRQNPFVFLLRARPKNISKLFQIDFMELLLTNLGWKLAVMFLQTQLLAVKTLQVNKDTLGRKQNCEIPYPFFSRGHDQHATVYLFTWNLWHFCFTYESKTSRDGFETLPNLADSVTPIPKEEQSETNLAWYAMSPLVDVTSPTTITSPSFPSEYMPSTHRSSQFFLRY